MSINYQKSLMLVTLVRLVIYTSDMYNDRIRPEGRNKWKPENTKTTQNSASTNTGSGILEHTCRLGNCGGIKCD